jgi:hypothetical protein
MAKRRDSAYFRRRLEKEHPAIYRELLSKKYPSVRAAAAAAGLIHLPTRLDALKREWRRATASEQRAFDAWVKAGARPKPRIPAIADKERRLRPDVRSFLADWVKANRLTPGRVLKAIGFTEYDFRLSRAVYHREPLPKRILDKLAPWLVAQGFRRRR